MIQLEIEVKNRYGISRDDDTQETSGLNMQRAQDFIEGYHQAEKDLHKSIYKAGFLDGFEDAVEGQYEKGYEQAEKDLELTWEDMQNIRNIIAEMMVESYTGNSSWPTHEEFSKEMLKRFKDFKERIKL